MTKRHQVFASRIRGRRAGVLCTGNDAMNTDTSDTQIEPENEFPENEFIDQVMHLCPVGITRTDMSGNIIQANAAARKILGIETNSPLPSFTKETNLEITTLDDRPFPEKELPFNAVKNSLKPVSGINCIIRHPDKKKKTVVMHASPLLDASGRFQGTTCIIEDLTDKKRMESELLQAQKLEAIGILAGGVAHDFNNILFPIMGLTELLMESDMVVPEGALHLKEIHKAANRAKDLVRQILTISRQSYSNTRVPVDIQSLIKEIIKLSKATLPSTIRIVQKISRDCGPVQADPAQIHQIMLNLIVNAFHAMEETGGFLTISLSPVTLEPEDTPSPTLEPGHYACLTVTDTGIGMHPDVVQDIFNPYFTTKEKQKGTGLGLSIVKGLIATLNGDILVDSTPGKGSTFTVFMPMVKCETQSEKDEDIPAVVNGSETIMVIDDETAITRTLKLMLERNGYHVTSFFESPAALESFYHQPDRYDLVITDMTMPDMTGLDLARKFIKIRPDIPIVLMTGHEKKMTPDELTVSGIIKLLHKPVSKGRLLETIQEVLN